MILHQDAWQCLFQMLLKRDPTPLAWLACARGGSPPPCCSCKQLNISRQSDELSRKKCRFENSDLFPPEYVLPNLVKISCWGDLRGWFPSYNESIFKQSKFCRYSIDDTAFSVQMRGCFSICQTFSFLRISCGPLRYLAAIKSSFIPFIHFQMTEECNLENWHIRQPFSF